MSHNNFTKNQATQLFSDTGEKQASDCDPESTLNLEKLVDVSSNCPSVNPSEGTHRTLLGECIAVEHPTLRGRVLVQWSDADGKTQKKWLPTLQNLPVRQHDRLLLVKPENWAEMIVTGVVDGFARRPEITRRDAGHLKLKRDERIRINSMDGKELLELFQSESGPVLRVLQKDTSVELPGKLKFSADSIELEAGAGPIHIKSTDDVRINGEMIHLN